MDILQGMVSGFSVCLGPAKLLSCFFGVLVGTAIGVLPGIGPAGAMSLLFLAFVSVLAGPIGVIGLMVLSPPLAEFALKFGPPEIFALVFLAFTLVAFLASGSMIKSLMMVVLGLLLATVGQEAITAIPRFTFGSVDLQSGLDLVPLIMGLFGLSEVLLSLEEIRGGEGPEAMRPTPKIW